MVDPRGETHPVSSRLIAPHSYVKLNLPPRPRYYGGYYYPGPDLYWSPFWYPYWDLDYYYVPGYRIYTEYDWAWRKGSVRLHLAYEQEKRVFEHDFTLDREEIK